MAGPFKMKAGKEGPMKKNFPSALKKKEDLSVKPQTKRRATTEAELNKVFKRAVARGEYSTVKPGDMERFKKDYTKLAKDDYSKDAFKNT